MSDIKDIVAALERALELPPPPYVMNFGGRQESAYSTGQVEALRDEFQARAAPLLNWAKQTQEFLRNQFAESSAGVALGIQRCRADEAEAKLSRAVELLKDAEDFCPKPYSTAISAFLKEAGHE